MPHWFESKAADAVAAFRSADSDKDGRLSVSELMQAASTAGAKPWCRTRVAYLVKRFDKDGDGQLDQHEFKELLAYLERGASVHEEITEVYERLEQLEALHVDELLSEGRKGNIPVALKAELALAATKAVYINQEMDRRLEEKVKAAGEAAELQSPEELGNGYTIAETEEPVESRHAHNKRGWEDKLERVRAEGERLRESAPNASAVAMKGLMPMLAEAEDLYNKAFDKVKDSEEAHLSRIHALCEAITRGTQHAKPFRQKPTEAAVAAIQIPNESEDPGQKQGKCHPLFLVRMYFDAQRTKLPLENAVQAALGTLAPGVAMIKTAPLKGARRAIAKAVEEYEGDFSRLQDLTRVSIECKTAEGAAHALKALKDSRQLRLTRAKDRLSGLTATFDPAVMGGYRDVMLNALLGNHLVEIQVHLTAFLEVKKSGVGHTVYKYARELHGFDQERIEFNGRLSEKVLREAKEGSIMRKIDASDAPPPERAVLKLVPENLLAMDSLLLELNMNRVKLRGSWVDVFGRARLQSERLHTLKMMQAELSGPLPVMQLPNLQTLVLQINDLSGGLEPLEGCKSLTALYLRDNQLTGTLEPLSGLAKLLLLDVSNNRLEGGLAPLKGCTAPLRGLDVRGNQELNITKQEKVDFARQIEHGVQLPQTATGAVEGGRRPQAAEPRAAKLEEARPAQESQTRHPPIAASPSCGQSAPDNASKALPLSYADEPLRYNDAGLDWLELSRSR